MKETNSLFVYPLATLCVLHLAAFIALTVHQIERISDLEKNAELETERHVRVDQYHEERHPSSKSKRSPDQDGLKVTIRETCRETTLEILGEFAEYLVQSKTNVLNRNGRQTGGNEMAKIFEQLANAEVGLFEKYCTNDSKLCTPGPQGVPGQKGDYGQKGDPGLKGLDGIQGPKGEMGLQGLQGVKGEMGLAGVKGDTGLAGPIGPPGPSGLKGDPGLDGVQGPPGRDGTRGPPGPTQSTISMQAFAGPSCCDALAKPTFTQTQELIKVTEGSTAVINCDVNGSPFPSIQWTPSPSSLSSRHHINGTAIVIDNVSTNDSLIYNCLASNALGSAGKQIVLEVFKHINIDEIPENHTLLIGLPVKIECKFSGIPTPTISWFHELDDGTRVPVTTGVYSIPGGSQIQLISTLPNDAGKYICQATNGVETIERSAYLITEGPPKIQMPPVIEVVAGKDFTLHCNAVGYPQPTTTWFPPPNVNNVYENSNGDLVMLKVVKKDEGPYQCSASNKFGTDTQTLILKVKETPQVDIKTNQVSVGKATTNFAIDCSVHGEAPLTVQWYKDGSPISMNAKHVILADKTLLVLGVTVPNDLGKYMCVASNSLGSDNKTAVVYEDKGKVTCDASFAACEVICGVQCPSDCPQATAPVYGTDRYDLSSSVCRSGVHSGVIRTTGGEVIWENAAAQPPYVASTRNGVTSSSLSSATSLNDAIILTV